MTPSTENGGGKQRRLAHVHILQTVSTDTLFIS